MNTTLKTIVFLIVVMSVVVALTLFKKDTVVEPVMTSSKISETLNISSSTTKVTTNSKVSYTKSDIAKHNNATDCWTIVSEDVFDLTSFIGKHPGGVETISQMCGVDGTVIFTKMHGTSENAQKALSSLKIGILAI